MIFTKKQIKITFLHDPYCSKVLLCPQDYLTIYKANWQLLEYLGLSFLVWLERLVFMFCNV